VEWSLKEIIAATAIFFSLVGAILAAYLKPMFDDWFAQKRRTIEIKWKDIYETKTPHESVKMEWNDHRFQSLHTANFVITNRSGRTQRDFAILAKVASKPTISDFAYLALQENDRVHMQVSNIEGTEFNLNVAMFPPGEQVEGNIISSF
jgi:hypothetical protein